MKHLRIIFVFLVLLTFAYATSFAFWWMGSPAHVSTEAGEAVHYVELHMTPFRWHTVYVWLPAILFMEHVRGYHLVKEVAAEQNSVYVYAK